MSEVVATGVSTVTDIGSRLAAFSIAVTVPYSGRSHFAFFSCFIWSTLDSTEIHSPLSDISNMLFF